MPSPAERRQGGAWVLRRARLAHARLTEILLHLLDLSGRGDRAYRTLDDIEAVVSLDRAEHRRLGLAGRREQRAVEHHHRGGVAVRLAGEDGRRFSALARRET